MKNDRILLDEAKRRVPLSLAAEKLGLAKLKPNGVQRSPFRPDRHPSFNVSDDTLWRDFSTNEGGDVVSFVMAATGCSINAAINSVLAMAGIERNAPLPPLKPRPPAPPPPPPRDALRPLALRAPTIAEMAKIQHQRNWPVFAGIEIAHRRGFFHMADVRHRDITATAWVLTDSARKTGMARRLDGEGWRGPEGSTFKSLSLRSDKANPVGLADVVEHNRSTVILAEGDPDFLAAITFAWLADLDAGFVRLDGNSRAITPEVATALKGRRVRILIQHDAPRPDGRQPAKDFAAAWVAALVEAGITADGVCAFPLRPPKHEGDFDFADALGLPLDLDQHEANARAITEGLK